MIPSRVYHDADADRQGSGSKDENGVDDVEEIFAIQSNRERSDDRRVTNTVTRKILLTTVEELRHIPSNNNLN